MIDIQDQALIAIIKIITSHAFFLRIWTLLTVSAENSERNEKPFHIRIIGACRALAQGDFTHYHSQVNNIVHKEMAIKCGLWKGPPVSYCKYELQSVLEKCSYKLQYDRSTITDRTVRYNKPGIVLLARTIKETYTTDVAIHHHQYALEVKRLGRRNNKNLATENGLCSTTINNGFYPKRFNLHPRLSILMQKVTQFWQKSE